MDADPKHCLEVREGSMLIVGTFGNTEGEVNIVDKLSKRARGQRLLWSWIWITFDTMPERLISSVNYF